MCFLCRYGVEMAHAEDIHNAKTASHLIWYAYNVHETETV